MTQPLSRPIKELDSILRHLLSLLNTEPTDIAYAVKEMKDNSGQLRQYVRASIEVKDNARLLIGAKGSHLAALQHVARGIVSHAMSPAPHLTIDVNSYVAMREQAVLNIAEQAARKAGRTRHAVVLPPMTASQRHAIHSSLAARQDIKTESLGQEPNRRIVIRPVF